HAPLFPYTTLFRSVKTFSKITQINTSKHDLLCSGSCELLYIPQYSFNGIATAMTTRQWNSTESTIVIAAILHFEKSARAIVDGVRTVEALHFLYVAGTDFSAVAFG